MDWIVKREQKERKIVGSIILLRKELSIND